MNVFQKTFKQFIVLLNLTINRQFFLRYLPNKKHRIFLKTADPVRYATFFLAINTILNEKIQGSFAELGVWQGKTTNIVHNLSPENKYYLFDTFTGFVNSKDTRFKETSENLVLKNIENTKNIIIKKGFFPDTTTGLEKEQFSFVILDADLYESTLAGLNFFYNKMNKGGYIFIHDYNSPESDWGVSKAVKEFMFDKPEKIIEIPDAGGSIIFRKI